MDGRYLLDTNIIIALWGDDAGTKRSIGEAQEVYLPSIVVGELYFGGLRSKQVAENRLRIDHLVNSITVLSCDEKTAAHYGEIKEKLWSMGRPIPDNDIWIAAIARQHGLTLVTRDDHFQAVEHAILQAW